MVLPSPERWRRVLRAGVLGGILAFLSNLFPIQLLPGIPLFAGSALSLLAALAAGPLAGLMAGLMGGAGHVLADGHWWALPLMAIEGLVVGWLVARRWSTFVAGAAFWLVVGGPLFTVLARAMEHNPVESLGSSLLRIPLMGMLLLALAEFLLIRTPAGRWLAGHEDWPGRSLRQQVFAVSVVLSSLTIVAVTGLVGRHLAGLEESREHTRLERRAREFSAAISAHVEDHRRGIETAARLLAATNRTGREELEAALAGVRSVYPGFLSMLVADADGRKLATHPRLGPMGQDTRTFQPMVNDREYFREVLRTGRPFISPAFQGRTFGDDPIVALSAPVRDRDGHITGVVEGSLNLRLLGEMDAETRVEAGSGLVVLDQKLQVVYATAGFGLKALDAGAGSLLLQRSTWHGRDGDYLVERAATRVGGWTVVVLHSAQPVRGLLRDLYGRVLMWLLCALVVAGLLGRWLAIHVSRPLGSLLATMNSFQFGAQPRPQFAASQARGTPNELVELAERFDALAARLDESYGSLESMLRQREELNEKLQAAAAVLERRVAERTAELGEAKAAAEQASEAKSRFLTHMSHELRTPMNGLQGMIQLLWLSQLTTQQSEYLQGMEESAETLVELVDGLLDLSKIEAGKAELELTEFQPRAVLESAVRQLAPRAHAKGLRIEFEAVGALPAMVRGDQLRLKRILLNLIGNAIKFTSSGWIRLEAEAVPAGAAQCGLEMRVRDTGVGIAAERLEGIFETYAKGAAGTGLGLAICKASLELMGGWIAVESEEGHGATFRFSVPLEIRENREAVTPEPLLARSLEWQGPELKILLAEDQRISRIFATELLKQMGHTVETAIHGRAALELWRRGGFDLVLMDLQMPEMDGPSTVEQIRKEERATGRHTPVIALTAHAMSGLREKLLASGFDGYVAKPLHVARLCREMQSCLRGRPVGGLETPLVSTLPARLPGLDLEGALKAIGGREDLLRRMLESFRHENAGCGEELANAVRHGELQNVAALAHGVKGVAGSLGAGELYEAAAALERAGRDGQLTEARRWVPVFEERLKQVLASIDSLAPRSAPEAAAYQSGAVLECLERLVRLLEQQDLAALELLEELPGHGLPRARFAELQALTGRLDFRGAAACAERLMEQLERDAEAMP